MIFFRFSKRTVRFCDIWATNKDNNQESEREKKKKEEMRDRKMQLKCIRSIVWMSRIQAQVYTLD